jgi:hypothetical protein
VPGDVQSPFEGALGSGVALSEGTFAVGGRVVAVRCVGEAHWRDLTASLLPAPDGEADLRVDVWDAGETGIRPGRSAEEEAAFAGFSEAFVFTPEGRELRHFGPDFDMRFDRDAAVAKGWVEERSVPGWHRLRPWQRVLVLALASTGIETVHAGMVARNGAGVLLPGPNGSGKSSTTFACLAGGLSFLGDDAIAVDLAGPTGWTVHAVAKLSVAGLARFPELAALSEPVDDPLADERAVRLAVGSDLVVRSARIAAIAFPGLVDSEQSAARPLPAGRALTELLGASLTLQPWRLREGFDALSDLAGRVPAYTLEVGRDPVALAEVVASLLP